MCFMIWNIRCFQLSFWPRTFWILLRAISLRLHQGPSRARLGSLGRGSTLQRTPPKVMSAPGGWAGWAHNSYSSYYSRQLTGGLMSGEKNQKCRLILYNHWGYILHIYYISMYVMCVFFWVYHVDIPWSSGDCLFRIRWWLELLSRGPSRCFNVKEITLTSMQYLDLYGHRWTDIVFVFHSCPSLSISLCIYIYGEYKWHKCVWFNTTWFVFFFFFRCVIRCCFGSARLEAALRDDMDSHYISPQ